MRRRDFVNSSLFAMLGPRCVAASSLYTDVKIGMSTPADLRNNGVYVWLSTCAKFLEQAGLPTRIYPNSTLGGDRERTYQVQLGLLDINATGGDELSRWSPMLAASARPFLISSYDHLSCLIEHTPYLEHISASLRPHGLELVDLAYTASMVGLFTKAVPVRVPADLKPLRLRILSESDFALLRAWEVRGVQVAWEEVAQSLQTGIVDAYLNPPNVALMFGHGAVLDYFTDLRMGPATRPIVAATRWLDTLSIDDRTAVHRAFSHARTANRQWAAQRRATDKARLQEAGIEWIDLEEGERDHWINASRTIPDGRWETADTTAKFREWVESTRRVEQ